MPLRRDANGRFRRPTDEERWPNPSERERVQRIRNIFEMMKPYYAEQLRQASEDLKFLTSGPWAVTRQWRG